MLNEISFPYERMSTKTRFEEEVLKNSEMAYKNDHRSLPHKGWAYNTYLLRRNLNLNLGARWAGYASVIPNLCLTNKRPFALNNIDKDVKGSKGHYPAKILTKRLMRVRNVKKKCLNIFGGLFWKFLFSTFITVSQAYYSFFNFPLYYLTCVGLRYETSILTTISKRAHRRFLQLIHVKGAAVLHFNVVFPPTTIVWPMIANCTSHFTFCNRRMLSFDPSWGMRTTTTHRWTWSGHL